MKILVVDDNSINREVICFMLEDAGYEYIQASSGEEAIDKFLSEKDIELILMDVQMPKMSGVEAARKINRIKQDRVLSIIFVTALDETEILARCLEAGGDDFVPKPVDEAILLPKLKAHIRNIQNYKCLVKANADLRLHEQSTKREFNIVDRIFKNSVNVSDLSCPNINSYTSAMSLFNGDLVLTAPSASGGQYLIVGDFTGHGLAAAVGSLPVISVFRNFIKRQRCISELATEINNQLCAVMPSGMFFCAVLIHLENSGSRMTFWSGGMDDMLIIGPNGNNLRTIPSLHMPLGILDQYEFDESIKVIDVEIGSRAYVYTDGVSEAKNDCGSLFGEKKIVELLMQDEKWAIDRVVHAVREFSPASAQEDDITIVEILCKPCTHVELLTNQEVDIRPRIFENDGFPWNLSITIKGKDLGAADPIGKIVGFLGSFDVVQLHEDRLFTILNELYSNSLEHSVLKLDSKMKSTPGGFDEYYKLRALRIQDALTGWISISVTFYKGNPDRIKIEVSDNGDGFDHDKTVKAIVDENASHGRGLLLLEVLCSELIYSNSGRKATAWYDLVS